MKSRYTVGLAGLLIVAAATYWHRITKWSIWHDESYTAMLISYDWGEILRRTSLDVHPPLYYLVLKAWTYLFGNSLLAMRSLSALAALFLVVTSYFLVKRLFNAKVALFTSSFVALGAYTIRYAQEARMYMLVALLLLLATYILVVAIQNNRKSLLFIYAVLMAAAIYCHYYALFLIPAHWLYLLLFYRHRRQTESNSISLTSLHWWGSNFLILGLLGPWLPVAFKQFSSIQGAFWISGVTPESFLSTFTSFLIYREKFSLFDWQLLVMDFLIILLLVLIITAIIRNRLERRQLSLFGLYAGLPILSIFLLSLPPFQPIYNNRYFSLTSVAFYILLGTLVWVKPLNRHRSLKWLAITVIVSATALGVYNVKQLGNYNPDRNEHYSMKELSQIINSNYQSGDAIVSTNLSTYFDIRYHNQTSAPVRLHVDKRPDGIGNTSLIYDRDDILLYNYHDLDSARRIWLVTDSLDKDPQVPENWSLLRRTDEDYGAILEYLPMPATP